MHVLCASELRAFLLLLLLYLKVLGAHATKEASQLGRAPA